MAVPAAEAKTLGVIFDSALSLILHLQLANLVTAPLNYIQNHDYLYLLCGSYRGSIPPLSSG
jgi:hypothetical protein